MCGHRKAADSKLIDSFSVRNAYHCYNYGKHQGALLDIKSTVLSLKSKYSAYVYMQN